MKENKIEEKERLVKSTDNEGNPVEVVVKRPDAGDYRDSQVAYNKEFRKALDSGGLLRHKLVEYMEEQGIWSEDKQKKNDEYVAKIRTKEEKLKGGGIKLSDAKEIAMELRNDRAAFQAFLAERNALDGNSVEGQADNARFADLILRCVKNASTKLPLFASQDDYDAVSTEPYVIEACGELANMLYGLDPDYAQNLEENKFLKEFKFVNDDLRLVDNDGNFVDIDGKLLNEDGRYIAYRTEKGRKNKDPDELYFVNREGEEVIEVTNSDGEKEWIKKDLAERKPFLDDDGSPISEVKSETSSNDSSTPKKRKRTSKTEAETT
jgi:hypothetical protein